MTCYNPITAFRSKKDGKTIVFNTKEGHYNSQFEMACGQCRGCRLERSRIWAVRCMHEAQLHLDNHFLTLTYNDENLPNNSSLDKRHLQLFWKRLRKQLGKFRYFACSEYGDRSGRPHYHAIIFGLKIPDRKRHSLRNGNVLYHSEKIEKIWGKGNIILGNVTFESCAYVARYILKKITGKNEELWYTAVDEETGEVIYEFEKESCFMSRNPGIGIDFYRKYKKDIYQKGTDGLVITRGGIEIQPPKLYDKKFRSQSEHNEKYFEQIKERRKRVAIRTSLTPERRAVKKRLQENRINKQLIRKLE